MRHIARHAALMTLLLVVGLAPAYPQQPGPPRFRIETVAGTGKPGYAGDDGPAAAAVLRHPTAVAVDSKGNLYIADNMNRRIRKVTPDGTITTVMGDGSNKKPPLEGRATEMGLLQAYGVAVDGRDNLYVLARTHGRIYRLTGDGRAETFVGVNGGGFGGDGGPAAEAKTRWPNHMVADGEGNLFIADTGNQRIRKIDTRGIITTIAGTGEAGFGGDGGPATEAMLAAPSAIAIDREGNLFIADFYNHRIRKISTGGIITTVAGNGSPEYNGEGLPATEAQIGEPCGVCVDREGRIYIGDQVNRRMRVVDVDDRMYTVAGGAESGYDGDGGPATEAKIMNPDIIAIDEAGVIYFPDNRNNAIRKLVPIER